MASFVLVTLLAFGCTTKEGRSNDDSGGVGISDGITSFGDSDADGGYDDDGDEEQGSGDPPPLLDMGDSDEGQLPCGEGQFCECEVPPHQACDAHADTPIARALGLNCPNELQVTVSTWGSAEAIGKRSSFGNTDAFNPREGSQYVVMGSGRVAELDNVLFGCTGDLGAAFDPGTLPPPLVGTDVGPQTCSDNPELIGMGDCSNTIESQLAGSVNDYTELRFTAEVPLTVNSFSYDLAFLSYEYPEWYQSQYNDMYIGWLESEVWTGNISFDEDGAPISLNAGFLDYRDANADNDPVCQNNNCTAPELHGTCMEGHAATKWLTTTAGVQPGETITVIFAIFDMSDSVLDSYVFLDNFSWGCEGDAPPTTTPIG